MVADRIIDGFNVDGGDGHDTLDMSQADISIRIDLVAGTIEHNINANSNSGPGHGSDVTTLTDIENILAGSGNDIIIANNARNDFYGGAGNDTFIFVTSASAGNGHGFRDRILDFDIGDRVDLNGIAREFAGPSTSELLTDETMRQFVLIGENPTFGRPGDIKLIIDTINGKPVALLQGYVDDIPGVDFEIEIHGLQPFGDNFLY